MIMYFNILAFVIYLSNFNIFQFVQKLAVSILHNVGRNARIGCCDMGQNDTIGKIELNPSIVLSSDNTNCKNDIQLFHQLFDELSVYRDYH